MMQSPNLPSQPSKPSTSPADNSSDGEEPRLLKETRWILANWTRKPFSLLTGFFVIIILGVISKTGERLLDKLWPRATTSDTNPATMSPNAPISPTIKAIEKSANINTPTSEAPKKPTLNLASTAKADTTQSILQATSQPLQISRQQPLLVRPTAQASSEPSSFSLRNTSSIEETAVNGASLNQVVNSDEPVVERTSHPSRDSVIKEERRASPTNSIASEPIKTDESMAYTNRTGGVYEAINKWAKRKDKTK